MPVLRASLRLPLAALVLSLALASSRAHAGPAEEEESEAPSPLPEEPPMGPANVAVVNPLALIGGTLSGEYERVLSTWASVYVGPTFKLFDGLFSQPGVGPGARFGGRWYYRGGAPAGWFAELSGALGFYGDYGTRFSLGVVGGYNFLLPDFYVFSVGAGVDLLRIGGTPAVQVGISLVPQVRFAFGVTF